MSESVSESTGLSFTEALRLGSSELARGRTAEAQQHARVALKLRPGNPRAQHLMGLAFFREGQHQLAFEIFDKLSERYDDSVALHVNAGLAALYSGAHSEQALTHLQLAIGLAPGHRRALGHLGLLHLEAGDLELARAAFAEAKLDELGGEVEAGVDREGLGQRVRAALAELPLDETAAPSGDAPDDEEFGEVGLIVAPEVETTLELEAEPGDGDEDNEVAPASTKPASTPARPKLRPLTRRGREPLADRRAGGRRRVVSGEINTGSGDAGAKSKKRLPGVISGEIAPVQNDSKTRAAAAGRGQRPTVEVLLEAEASSEREAVSDRDESASERPLDVASQWESAAEDETAEVIAVVEDEPPAEFSDLTPHESPRARRASAETPALAEQPAEHAAKPADEPPASSDNLQPPADELDFSDVDPDHADDPDLAERPDEPGDDDESGPTLDEAIGAALTELPADEDSSGAEVDAAVDALTFEAGLPDDGEPPPPELESEPASAPVETDPEIAAARAARAAEIRAASEVEVAPLKSADLSRHTLSQPLLPALTAGERVELRRGRLYLRFGSWAKEGGQWTAIVRDDRTVLAQGRIGSVPARRRFAGAEAEPFVVEGRAFLRLGGDGLSIAEPAEGAIFDLLWLGAAQVLYLREDLLYAYSGTLHWENGHLPGEAGPAMVRLCGEGVVVAHGVGLACCPVREQAPVAVGRGVLAGWLGDVVVFPTRGGADGGVRDGYSCGGRGTLLLRSGGRREPR